LGSFEVTGLGVKQLFVSMNDFVLVNYFKAMIFLLVTCMFLSKLTLLI